MQEIHGHDRLGHVDQTVFERGAHREGENPPGGDRGAV